MLKELEKYFSFLAKYISLFSMHCIYFSVCESGSGVELKRSAK